MWLRKETVGKKQSRATHQLIAKKLGLERSTVTKVLGQDRKCHFNPKTIQRIFKTAKRLGYDFSRMIRVKRREFDRKPANLKARIRLCLKNNDHFDSGHAVIENISPTGALLKKVSLPKRTLPLDPFTVDLTILQGRLKGVQAKGEVVRFAGSHNMGMRFTEVDKASHKKLAQSVG